MSFLNKIESIKETLKESGYSGLAADILDEQLSGGTGGEVLIRVCAKLLEIKYTNAVAYKLVEIVSKELLSYAHSIGLFPEWNGKTN